MTRNYDAKCETCPYWELWQINWAQEAEAEHQRHVACGLDFEQAEAEYVAAQEKHRLGYCLRYPPTVTLDDESPKTALYGELTQRSMYRSTEAQQTCGEHPSYVV